jgi:transcriptional regulator with XRE-family HTH domain
MAEIASGPPGLTELGKRIEMLRIERGLSKQHLARHAGTSRQQLWRVMTGKSELTPTLRLRIADALNVAAPELAPGLARPRTSSSAAAAGAPPTVVEYVANPDAVTRTLATMPAGAHGWRVKRAYLDALEDAALASGHTLDSHFFDLRRRVLAGEL